MKTETTKVPANNKEGFVITDANSGEKDWGKSAVPASPKVDEVADKPAEDKGKKK